MQEGSVRIIGLKELNKGFKEIDADINKELRQEFLKTADKVVGVAQQRMPFGSGMAARSIKPRATQKSAGIAFPRGGPGSGDTTDGYFPWLDFGGGKAGARGITSSSPVAHAKSTGGFKRPHIKGGRYIYPAIAESSDAIGEAAYAAVMRAAVKAKFHTE